MRFFLLCLLGLNVLCRLALGGETPVPATTDPTGALFRLLTDFGALGVFIIYLIWQRKKDSEKKDEDSKRWYALDRELVGLVEKCTKAIVESTAVMSEIRLSIHENTREMRQMRSTSIYHRKLPETRPVYPDKTAERTDG